MRNVPRRILAAMLVSIVLVGAHAPRGSALHGTIRILELSAPSLHGARRTVRVYLPPSYGAPRAAARRYPVLYLLHGWPGSDGNLFQLGHAAESADSLIGAGAMPEAILVCPNGAGAGLLGRSYYIDGRDTTRRVEDFVVRDLVGWVDGRFRTLAEPRFRGVLGISDGGTAAVNLAFRHPDVFGACGAHSADFLLDRGLSTRGILGREPEASRLAAENSPMLYVNRVAGRIRGMAIYLDCGVRDESLENTRRFHRELLELGIPHAYHEYPGTHDWGYWRAHLVGSLQALTAGMRPGT